MSLKPFQYYLLTEDGRSYYVQNGIVSSRGIPTPLPQTPDGWQEVSFGWERNKAKHGLQRAFSKDLSFVLDGANILRDNFYKRNVDHKIYLLIQKLTLQYTTFYKWLYETMYKGEIDFSTVKDSQDGLMVTASIMEGGLSKMLNANQNTVYEIPLDDDAVTLRHDGIIIQNTVQGIPEERYNQTGGFYFENHIVGINLFSSETDYFGGSKSTLRTQVNNSNTNIRATGEYFFKATIDTTVNFEIDFPFGLEYTPNSPGVNPAAVFKIVVRRIDTSNVSTLQEELFSRTGAEGFNGNFRATGTFSMNVSEGDELYLFAFCNVEGATGDAQIRTTYTSDDDTIFKASFEYRHTESFIKCFTRAVLFRKLCHKIFGHEEYAVSTLLNSDNRLITSGDGLRGISGSSVKTSLQDFFTDIDTDLMAGMSIEAGAATTNLPAGDRLVIEERTNFYDDTDITDLGEVKSFGISYASDKIISSIKTGWKEPVIDGINGKYEFNGSQVYTTPQVRISNEYNLVSPYKSGPVDMEIIRINTDGKVTTDKETDNDLFVIVGQRGDSQYFDLFSFEADGSVMTKPSGFELAPGQVISVSQTTSNDGTYTVLSVSGNEIILDGTLVDESNVACLVEIISGGEIWKIKRETYDNENDPADFGVPDPTSIFNIDLSPKRKLLRHGRWIASMLNFYETEKILFQSGSRNTALKTVQGSTTIRENSDVSISSLGSKIFLPYIFNVRVDGDIDLPALMEDNPNRCFKFTWDGKEYKGFNLKAAFAPNELNEQEYSLLCTPDNDLTDLIV